MSDENTPIEETMDDHDEELNDVMDAQVRQSTQNHVTNAVFDSDEDLENQVQALIDYQHGSENEEYARDSKVKTNNPKALRTAADVLGPEASTADLMAVAQQLQGQNADAMNVTRVNGVDVTDPEDGENTQRFRNDDYGPDEDELRDELQEYTDDRVEETASAIRDDVDDRFETVYERMDEVRRETDVKLDERIEAAKQERQERVNDQIYSVLEQVDDVRTDLHELNQYVEELAEEDEAYADFVAGAVERGFDPGLAVYTVEKARTEGAELTEEYVQEAVAAYEEHKESAPERLGSALRETLGMDAETAFDEFNRGYREE